MKRWLVSVGLALLFVCAIGAAFGASAALGAGVVALLAIVVRHDNDAGLCLPLAVLFLLILGVCVLLLTLMAVTHRG